MNTRTLTLALLSSLIVAAILSPSARGAAADCQTTTVVAASEADTWVDANSVLANKGSDAVLNVGDTSRALVRFPLPRGVPEGCVMESARLRLFADSGTEGARVEVLPLSFSWSEPLVTWTTQPPALGSGVAAWSRDGYMQWNVTSIVPAMLDGANHGFLVRDAGEGTEKAGGHGFYAREKGENPPQLVIRFAAPQSGEPVPPAPPRASAVACGQLVTESTLVTNDLTNCPADGILIGAPRIVLDLGGHTVDGVGLGTGVRNEGYESVTIRNGAVQEFDRGVELLEETRRNLIEHLTLRHNQVAAIELFDAGGALSGNELRANTVDDNGGGIQLLSGTRGTIVSANTLTLNSGAALLLRDSDDNRLEGNRVVGGGDLGVGLERSSGNTLLGTVVSDTSDGGIEILAGSHGNRVEGSHVTQSGDTGILVAESERNELIANTTVGMSDSGITLNSANDGVVSDNKLGGNPGGLQMDGSSRNLIEANDASHGTGIGIELGGGSYGNTLVLNTANGNGAQGIYVADEALLDPGNVLQRNTANDNGSDGIAVAKGGHTLTANVALRNRGWGINAVGLNFAARNVADGNGQAGDCLGILCSPPDVTPPETSIESAPDAFVNTTTAVFAFSANEQFASFECSLDGEPYTLCSSPRLYLGLAVAEHEFRVRATDESGNVEPTPAVHRWEIDHTPPETAIDSGPAALTSSRTADLTFSAGEPSTFECARDDADYQPCTSPQQYSDLAEGDHTFRVRATDAAANTDPNPAVHAWTIDVTPPETTIDSAPPAITSGTTATLTFSTDEPATFECAFDDAAYEPCTSPQQHIDLAEGGHQFRVRATDVAGNTEPTPVVHRWTIDRTSPETTIDTAPDPMTSSATATFTFTAEEPGTTFECAVDDAAYERCASPAEYRDLAEGDHTFRVRATNTAGNTDPTPASHAWTIDHTAPESTIDTGPSTITSGTTATFTFSADEPATFECAVDDAAYEPCASPHRYTDLAESDHRLRVRATDRAGNPDPSPAMYAWTVDRTPPETTIEAAPDPIASATTAAFTFSADEPATFECALDDAAFEPCTSPADYRDLAEGDHRLRVGATDSAGNTDSTPAVHTWTVDHTQPETTIEAAPDPIASATTATFTFSADEPATFECALDDAAYERCTSPQQHAELAEGGHTFRVRATDTAGNTEPTPASHAWTIDHTPPETTIDSVLTSGSAATLTFSADEPATFECALDDAAFEPCTSPAEYRDLAEGDRAFGVRATDAAGNTDLSAATHQWTVVPPHDTTAPETTIDAGPDALTSSTSAAFSFSSSETGSTFECALDDAAFEPCTSPAEYRDLAEGDHPFRVRATDAAGNTDPTAAAHAWTIDRTPPETSIDTGPNPITASTSATFTFSADEAGSTFECSLDGSAFSRCASAQGYANLAAGDHQFRVRAIDRAGNADASPAARTWTIDRAAPQTTITSAPPTTTAATSARFEFSASEAGATFECSLDGAPFTVCASPRDYANLGLGGHDFRVRATDPAGNTEATPAGHLWTVLASSSCTAATVTAAAVEDSWVLESSPSSNYRSDSVLKVDTKVGANARVVVRFMLPPIPAGCQVTGARLRLYAGSYKTARTLAAFRLGAAWAEAGVTWNNQPATTGSAATTESGQGDREWQVTSHVRGMYTDGNHGFLIRDATENGGGVEQAFNSREKGSDNPPQLIITFG